MLTTAVKASNMSTRFSDQKQVQAVPPLSFSTLLLANMGGCPTTKDVDRDGTISCRQPCPANQYLSSELGRVLANCMAELCLQQPEDPIQFMAHWLYRYADFVLYTQEKAAFMQRVKNAMDELARERKARKERMLKAYKEYSEMRQYIATLSPSVYKAFFSTDSSKKQGLMNDGLDGDEFLEQMMSTFSSSDMSGTGTSKATTPSGKHTYSKKDKWFKLCTSMKNDAEKRDRFDSIDSAVSRHSRNRGDSEEFDFEDGEDTLDGSLKTKERRHSQTLRKGITAKDSLTASKKWRSRDSATHVYWKYEVPPGRIVCLHPLLGKLVAKGPPVYSSKKETCLPEDSPCQSLYDHEMYLCLPEHMLYVTPEHVDSDHSLESEDMQESEYSKSTLNAEEAKDVEAEGYAQAKTCDDEHDEDDDDVRWQTCTEDKVCEGWKICEGFDQCPKEGNDDKKKK
ncbi:hypothetical protein EGW08_016781 [Elysia chlorotica]|uniref:Uncharacterized protein n=1 Tax=Elysia chlorotica TaxID=188477 RepID=A0A433T1M8_ELYCH|nr:hypothetical protein EGW08_016781 [Elysia chlorotica]